VRVIGVDGRQLGILSLGDALKAARENGVDLVEIAPNANPPVCRLVDFGKYRYEQAKREKETKKHQHATRVKEVQLSPKIDPHDLAVKVEHGVDFLCEEMKVKVSLKFRGREMAHTEFGFQVVNKFLAEIAPYGQPDFQPKLIGRGINVMISPLPRNKRAKNPRAGLVGPGAGTAATNEHVDEAESEPPPGRERNESEPSTPTQSTPHAAPRNPNPTAKPAGPAGGSGFANSPFAQLEIKPG